MTADSEYPDAEELHQIETWPDHDPLGWFAFIRQHWWASDWGWHEYDRTIHGVFSRVYHVSTGGWSGNEDRIGAMRRHWNLWYQTWERSRRGGHYRFIVPLSMDAKVISQDHVTEI